MPLLPFFLSDYRVFCIRLGYALLAGVSEDQRKSWHARYRLHWADLLSEHYRYRALQRNPQKQHILDFCASCIDHQVPVTLFHIRIHLRMQPQTLRPKSVRAVRGVVARAQRRISSVRPYVAVASRSRAARGTALSVASAEAANVAPSYVPTKQEAKKPKKQIITVAVDGSENSTAGLIFLLDTFSGTGVRHSACLQPLLHSDA